MADEPWLKYQAPTSDGGPWSKYRGGAPSKPDTDAPGPWPEAPTEPQQRTDSPVGHVLSAAGDAFKGPYGPQKPLLNPDTFTGPVASGINQAYHIGGAVLDAAGRPIQAAIRGDAAEVSEAARALGMDETQAK